MRGKKNLQRLFAIFFFAFRKPETKERKTTKISKEPRSKER